MANRAWPHTPGSDWARVVLVGPQEHLPDDGEQVGFLPPDTAAPVQIVWSTWKPWGFTAWLYEWHGEALIDRGRTDALIYRAKRVVPMEEFPPAIGDATDVWADAVDLI